MFAKWPLELIIWSGALIFFGLSYPQRVHHFTLCPLENLGFSWCPGCGLGRSVSYLLHGEFSLSFKQHWFGIPAFGILICRILQLLNKFLLNLLSKNNI
ncbi:MAG: DUF2752 domain-containing protein [Daejeonella sp.]|uniref:DUF2752 domain-containing protein n=1 Tax=Daejeonella sp. JGW-45 TaxID=3034148 RepID=UPI0023EA9A72|nr:DUF2752 domain-containing protein [Daejeonella sp. JGW-45]